MKKPAGKDDLRAQKGGPKGAIKKKMKQKTLSKNIVTEVEKEAFMNTSGHNAQKKNTKNNGVEVSTKPKNGNSDMDNTKNNKKRKNKSENENKSENKEVQVQLVSKKIKTDNVTGSTEENKANNKQSPKQNGNKKANSKILTENSPDITKVDANSEKKKRKRKNKKKKNGNVTANDQDKNDGKENATIQEKVSLAVGKDKLGKPKKKKNKKGKKKALEQGKAKDEVSASPTEVNDKKEETSGIQDAEDTKNNLDKESFNEEASKKKNKKNKKKKAQISATETKPDENESVNLNGKDSIKSEVENGSQDKPNDDVEGVEECPQVNGKSNTESIKKAKKKKKNKNKKSEEEITITSENVENNETLKDNKGEDKLEETAEDAVMKSPLKKKKNKGNKQPNKTGTPTEELKEIKTDSPTGNKTDENIDTMIETPTEITDAPMETESPKGDKKKNKKRKSLEPANEETKAGSETPNKKKRKSLDPVNSVESTGGADVALNTVYNTDSAKDKFAKHWTGDGDGLKEDGFEIIKKPFTCGYLSNFLQDPKFLEGVKKELADITPIQKNNDLYKFKQTPDLKSSSAPCISALREFLYGPFRAWLARTTGVPLNDTVDMGSSTYQHTDVLLCHDDELEGRRVAYILYLVPPWTAKDGGTLDLFDTDEHGQPRAVVRSLVPEWNAFAFFEVSPVSFHQVSEVLTGDKTRLSINGWFHGPPIPRPPKYEEPPRPMLKPAHVEEDEIYAWINPTYLDESTQKSIRKKFCDESEISLDSFFTDEKYKELEAALKKLKPNKWTKVGPANKCSYKVVEEGQQPDVVRQVVALMRSEAVFLILAQLTGLKLHALAPEDSSDDDDDDEPKESNPRVSVGVRRWGHGSYTLVRDCDVEGQESHLDASLFVNVSPDWSDEHGGFNTYMGKDEDSELLCVVPRANCLALVYCDQDTLKVTKHVNSRVTALDKEHQHYFDVGCKYLE